MRSFVSNLWQVVHPYRLRFYGGCVLGVLAGLRDPVLAAAVWFVFAVVFPQVDAKDLEEIMKGLTKLAEHYPTFANWVMEAINSLKAEPTLLTALGLFSIVPLVMLVGGVANYGYIYYMQWVAVRSIGDLRAKLYNHLLHLPPGFLQQQSTGELMARLNNDVFTLHNLLAQSVVSMIRDPIALISLLTGLVVLQPRLSLMALVILPVSLVPIIVFARKLRKSSKAAQSRNAEIFKSMHEGLTGARVIKAYNLEPVVLAEFRERVRSFCAQHMRTIRAAEIPSPMIEFFGALAVTGILAAISVDREGITAADFITFLAGVQLSYTKLKFVTRMVTQVIQARAASSRVFELLHTASDLPEPAHPKPVQAAGAEIRFENLTFGYGNHQLFGNFNLTVKPGQLVALVGQSGSGKTTLTNLLLRFYDPQDGTIRIGGTDIRDVASRDLRSQIAVVGQETILFNESIRRNIELGRPGASEAEIQEAARHAHAEEFIRAKPGGYDFVVGEKGANLSGGQRQRLAIARAILKDAPILILDEATSSLDTESERAVQAALNELMQGRTTLCIAHRLSTIQHADVIVVLEKGRIVEMGSHKELLARGGLYQKLHSLQFGAE